MRIFVSTFIFVVLIFISGAKADGFFNRESEDRKSGYTGGGGLITYYGQTGMFLNPTSGTQHAGDLSPQSCVLLFNILGDDVIAHAALLTYGVTDWLEVGIFGLGVYGTPGSPIGAGAAGPGPGPGGPGVGVNGLAGASEQMGVGQFNLKTRLLKDEGMIPEFSIGGMYREGHRYLRQQSVFAAASKGFQFSEDGPWGLRLHAGFKQIWQDPDVKEANGSIVYGGLDISVPYNLHIVGEISTKDDVYIRVPISAGVQWRDPRGYGLSLAWLRSDDWGENSIYIGVGINF